MIVDERQPAYLLAIAVDMLGASKLQFDLLGLTFELLWPFLLFSTAGTWLDLGHICLIQYTMRKLLIGVSIMLMAIFMLYAYSRFLTSLCSSAS